MSTSLRSKPRARSHQTETAGLPQNLFWNALGQCFDLSRYDPIQPEASQLADPGSRSVVKLDLEAAPTAIGRLAAGSNNGFPPGTEQDGRIEISNAESETRSIYTRRDYQKTFAEKSRTKVSGPLGRNSFSGSESFSKTVRTSSAKTRMSTFNDRQVVRFAARLQTESGPASGGPVRLTLDLDRHFLSAVAGLPVSGDWGRPYAQFIGAWGTHFAESIEVGGRAYLTSIFEENQYEKMVRENLKVSVAAKGTFRGVTGSGGATYEQQTARAFQEITGISRTQIFAVGGTLQDDLDKWVTTISENPGVVNTSLRPLYDLLHDGHFPGDSDIALKRTLLMLAVQDHLDEPLARIESYPGLMLYKNKEFDNLRRVVYYSSESGGTATGLDKFHVTSVIAARGCWKLIVASDDVGYLDVSPSQGSLFPHSDSWGQGHDVNDDLIAVEFLKPDPADEAGLVYLFPKEQMEGNDSDQRPMRVAATRGDDMEFVPRSALVANGRWMLYRNGDLVGQLLDPAGGDTPGQPGQYRQLTVTPGSNLVEIELQTPILPWQPRSAPSIKPSDMAHLMSEKDYANGRWSGQTWTHVRYAVSFATSGQESFVGPWSSWLGFAADNVIMPRIYDLPIDETGPDSDHPVANPISSRRIYRQFGADLQAGEPAKLDRPELVMEVDDATSTKTESYDSRR